MRIVVKVALVVAGSLLVAYFLFTYLTAIGLRFGWMQRLATMMMVLGAISTGLKMYEQYLQRKPVSSNSPALTEKIKVN